MLLQLLQTSTNVKQLGVLMLLCRPSHHLIHLYQPTKFGAILHTGLWYKSFRNYKSVDCFNKSFVRWFATKERKQELW
jgi:hypothetical protein